MGHIGCVFLIYAFIFGVAACLAFASGIFKNGTFIKYAFILKILQTVSLAASFLALFQAVFHNDFSLAYVSNYSDISLPILYKISALWSGTEGYLLFLALFASVVSVFETIRSKKFAPGYYRVLNFITTFFVVLLTVFVLFVLNPFKEMDFTPVNGSGLDPALQNVPMFIYPIASALVFISSFIVFAWALSALILKDYGIYWLKSAVIWVYSTTVFMMSAIFCGGVAAFNRISHSGFWDWDLLETASAIPFIISLSLLHSSIICLNRGRKKRLSFFLPFVIFELLLFFLYIAGGFERSRGGLFIHIFMVLVAALFIPLFVRGYKKLRSIPAVILRPKEIAINIADTIILTASLFLFIGMTFQFLVNSGVLKNVFFINPAYYSAIILTASALCIALMGLLAWKLYSRCDYPKTIKFIYILTATLVGVVFVAIAVFKAKPIFVIFLSLALFAMSAMAVYALKATYKTELTGARGKKKFYVRLITHMGFLTACVGVVVSTSYYKEYYIETSAENNFQVAEYNFLVSGVDSLYKENYLYTFVDMTMEYKGKLPAKIAPEIRNYDNSRKLYAEIKNKRVFLTSISVAFISYDFKTNDIELFIAVYPFIWLVPIGVLILVLGTVYAAFGKRISNE